MSKRRQMFAMLLGLILCGVEVARSDVQEGQTVDQEYKVKAAFLYNFLKTIDIPKDEKKETTKPFLIGVLGEDSFGGALDRIMNKTVKNRSIEVQKFGIAATSAANGSGMVDVEGLRACHILFVGRSERDRVPAILAAVKGAHVVTVGETEVFLEQGGIINFIPTADKGEFEINLARGREEKLNFSSKLLRIAKRVIQDKG